ncbi:Cell surface mannoprotein mp65 [Entomophthora muscae]|uniref:Cell surface mannoprotein mp65 n=1 Tax=Entomophthora muscae TaxID=34485 RepID=A0ACC2SCH6_9FUNG|nr:Cell surface mannoprotein mp65 [Entomophthora muscae]
MQFSKVILAVGSTLAMKCRMSSGGLLTKPVVKPLPVEIPPTVSPVKKLSGMTYSPYGAQDQCLPEKDIRSQISSVIKLTDNIRLYSADCRQLEYVLGALADYNWQGKVLVGIWTRSGEERIQSDINQVTAVIKNPRFQRFIASITVGNEERYNNIPEHVIIGNIARVRSHLAQQGIYLPVSTVDTYKLWTPNMMQHSDIIYSNIYPFHVRSHGDGSVKTAVQGALAELQELRKRIPSGKQLVVSETGWATSGSAPVSFRAPDVSDQHAYIAAFQCLVAIKEGIPSYFLEAYDASWKKDATAEKHFGILDKFTYKLKANANFDVLFTKCV